MLLAPTDTFTVTNNFQTNGFAEIGLATGTTRCSSRPSSRRRTDTAASTRSIADNAARARDPRRRRRRLNYLSNQTTKAIPLPWLTADQLRPRVGAEATFDTPVILDWPQQHLEVPAASR